MEPAPSNQTPGEGSAGGANGVGAGGSSTGIPGASRTESSIGRQLGGDLPCIVCGYNLRGLSIRGVCPECGTTVRAAILAVVDPQANILQPIRLPGMVAGSIIAWIVGGLAATLIMWLPHVLDLLGLLGVRLLAPQLRHALVAVLMVSGLGAAGLIRPHARIPAWKSGCAAAAAILYVPLSQRLYTVIAERDARSARPVLTGWQPTREGTATVVTALLLAAAILVLMRPIARLLVARSLLMRSGRVDRQTLWGMAAAAVVIAAGQLAGRAGGAGVMIGLVVMFTGATLLTIGLFGSLADALRIATAVTRPRYTVKQVVRRGVGPAIKP